MHKLTLLFYTTILSMNIQAQEKALSPLEVVQQQLDAYNKQDIKAFAAVFAENVLVYNKIGDTKPAIQGRMAVEKRYGELFIKYPKNYSTLIGRIVEGDYVIDHEVVTGRDQLVRIVAIYEVKNGQISQCWFIR